MRLKTMEWGLFRNPAFVLLQKQCTHTDKPGKRYKRCNTELSTAPLSLTDWLTFVLTPLVLWRSALYKEMQEVLCVGACASVCGEGQAYSGDSAISLLHRELWLNTKYVQERHLLTPRSSLGLHLALYIENAGWKQSEAFFSFCVVMSQSTYFTFSLWSKHKGSDINTWNCKRRVVRCNHDGMWGKN